MKTDPVLSLKLSMNVVEAIDHKIIGARFSPFGLFGTMSGGTQPLIVAQYAHIIEELEKEGQER